MRTKLGIAALALVLLTVTACQITKITQWQYIGGGWWRVTQTISIQIPEPRDTGSVKGGILLAPGEDVQNITAQGPGGSIAAAPDPVVTADLNASYPPPPDWAWRGYSTVPFDRDAGDYDLIYDLLLPEERTVEERGAQYEDDWEVGFHTSIRPPDNVPTLTGWGVAGLALILMITGVLVLRRRKQQTAAA
ncbi:hypothetical protein ACFL6M_07165 [Candidatus Eisenbacteria bacterium]|uniref:LPXTG cell wall anchor domain-containing protein n=1 Tax=Eiseniibacteriota bacterium TaxID=2212470 RepID=A0ABV6YMI2_UNCEI